MKIYVVTVLIVIFIDWTAGDCGRPVAVANSFSAKLKEAYTEGEKVTYFCIIGFISKGDDTSVECLSNGDWSTYPQCIPVTGAKEWDAFELPEEPSITVNDINTDKNKCNPPQEIPNGILAAPNGYGIYSRVFYKCKVGFYLEGNLQRHCTKLLQWDGAVPNCRRGCLQPNIVPHAVAINRRSGYPVGSKIALQCEKGYDPSRPNTVIECLEVLEWSESYFSCDKLSCGYPGNIYNGIFIGGENYEYGDVVNFKCNEGYTLIGNSKIVCDDTRYWSGSPPLCKPLTCPSPDRIENSVKKEFNEEYSINEVIFYKCETGFKISADWNSIKCLETGKWSAKPKCVAVECKELPIIFNGHIEATALRHFYRDTITISCLRGFELQGNSMVSCDKYGQWETVPTCEQKHTCIREATEATYSASSSWKYLFTHFKASEGTLIGRGWMADSYKLTEYLEIAFKTPQNIAKIRTKGGRYRGHHVYYKKIKIQYKPFAGTNFITLQENGQDKIFDANTDSSTEVDQMFKYGELQAIAIRIYPVAYNRYLFLRAGIFVYC